MAKAIGILLLAAVLAPFGGSAETEARLVLLGTAGGPTPKKTRAAPAKALQVGDRIYLVDCGNGVGRQMALAGLPLPALRNVFVTHHHSDHAADLTTLPVLAWAAGLEETVTLYGPKPLRSSVRTGLRQHRFDVETRRKDEGRTDFGRLIRLREFRRDGVILRDGDLTVRAARVDHPPIEETYAYRFDLPGWSVVISGDTAPSENLVRLAKGADVLVHEVLLRTPAETSEWLGLPLEHPLVRHIARSHTSYEEVGRIAREAGVRTLVLSHFVPGDEAVDEEKVLSAIRRDFQGEVIFGTDLLEIRPGNVVSAR
jgi:ribonuclease BN (tRNA processing enzyme)